VNTRQRMLERYVEELRRGLGISKRDEWPLPRRYAKMSVRLSHRIQRQLAAASPGLSKSLSAEFAVDLADIWEVGRCHEAYLQSFLKLRFPRDRDRLESLLIHWVEVELLVHCRWHLNSLKKRTPRVMRGIQPARTKKGQVRP
jgi:hypothetical protein